MFYLLGILFEIAFVGALFRFAVVCIKKWWVLPVVILGIILLDVILILLII